MRLINTNEHYWEIEAWNAAENREPFYMVNLTAVQTDFLKAVEKRFRRHTIWSPDGRTVYFNSPLQTSSVEAAQLEWRSVRNSI